MISAAFPIGRSGSVVAPISKYFVFYCTNLDVLRCFSAIGSIKAGPCFSFWKSRLAKTLARGVRFARTRAMDSGAGAAGASPMQHAVGMGKCYVFKSRLQEYAQRAGFNTPEYHTIKEGLSHDPVFRSTVVVNNVRYESLPGFSNRKAAEQSAAEVALLEILKSGQTAECIPAVHETGLCKNMLQEYAQKMNYAMPSYVYTQREEGSAPYICTVEIGGIRYIGAASKFKKEAELKAARTALIAIQRQENDKNGTSQYTVLPTRKKAPEPEKVSAETKKLRPKKSNMKRKWKLRKKSFLKKHGQKKNMTVKEENGCNGTEALQTSDVTMSEVAKVVKEESGKPSFDENQVGANCEFNANLDQLRAVKEEVI